MTKALHAATECELEYVMQFADGEGFQHVHFHLVARARDWPAEYKGPKVFAAWSVKEPVFVGEGTRVIEAVGAQLGVRPAALVD